jgi:hypothetical protein
MNTAKKIIQRRPADNMEPILRKVLIEAEHEHRQLQEMFALMGWGDLPDALKIEIKDDVAAMADELKGNYSSCDPYIARRRQSVVYWINSYEDSACSLQTAIEALRVKKL